MTKDDQSYKVKAKGCHLMGKIYEAGINVLTTPLYKTDKVYYLDYLSFLSVQSQVISLLMAAGEAQKKGGEGKLHLRLHSF